MFICYCYAVHRDLPSFPTRRSSDLRRFQDCLDICARASRRHSSAAIHSELAEWTAVAQAELGFPPESVRATAVHSDRKSTRLNSSHVEISYAVFCLKKKITIKQLSE